MPFLSFNGVGYHTSGKQILNGVSFQINRGDRLILLGLSGSGKTTILRLINRLLTPTAGEICFESQDLSAIDPIALRRRTGYVIQELGLFPHWTVEQNIALVPRLLEWPEQKRHQRAMELLEQVGLGSEDLAQRKPRELSGGQRQRVAVARALAAEPDLLLFDEPFGALDPITRQEMQQQVLTLSKRYGLTVVFVTHDVAEALVLGTKIAVLSNGLLECVVSPQEFALVQTPVAKAFLHTLPPAVPSPGATA